MNSSPLFAGVPFAGGHQDQVLEPSRPLGQAGSRGQTGATPQETQL